MTIITSRQLECADREALVREMAEHIVAAIISGKLCTANDGQVIEYLWNAPQLYHHRLILDHMDDAMVLAKEILNAAAKERSA